MEPARAQVRHRAAQHATARGVDAHWLDGGPAEEALRAVEGLGQKIVIGSDLVLWMWRERDLRRLSDLLRYRRGLLVFIEPTAGLGLRRPAQLVGKRYRRDLPAELRSAGFSVTTQVRLHHGLLGTYVRGEAQHFESPGQAQPS